MSKEIINMSGDGFGDGSNLCLTCECATDEYVDEICIMCIHAYKVGVNENYLTDRYIKIEA